VIVSADAEWRAVAELFSGSAMERTPYGEFFYHDSGASRGVVMRGGWGKIDAAASTQYGISRWRPSVVVNLGTCGGILGQIEQFETVLAERTVVYDITERMGDAAEAIRSYSTTIDLDWLGSGPLPSPARRALLVSADRDVAPADIPLLRRVYQAIAVDWESGAIARVASRNGKRVVMPTDEQEIKRLGGGPRQDGPALMDPRKRGTVLSRTSSDLLNSCSFSAHRITQQSVQAA
jgi:adenosylhomocysteine nucleosidase